MLVLAKLLFGCSVASLLISSFAHAADMTCKRSFGTRCFEALLSGPIEKGDYVKFAALYTMSQSSLSRLLLQSPGGNVAEAIKLGLLLRRHTITAKAPTYSFSKKAFTLSGVCTGGDCVCASACALIWFGAPDRMGTVGLHRPHFRGTSFGRLSPGAAAQIYRPMLESVAAYLSEMEAPRAAIEAMAATGSAEIKWYSAEDYEERAPSFAEWQDAACGAFGKDKETTEFVLEEYADEHCVAQSQDARCVQYSALKSERERRFDCIFDLLSTNRKKLPLPDTGSSADAQAVREYVLKERNRLTQYPAREARALRGQEARVGFTSWQYAPHGEAARSPDPSSALVQPAFSDRDINRLRSAARLPTSMQSAIERPDQNASQDRFPGIAPLLLVVAIASLWLRTGRRRKSE